MKDKKLEEIFNGYFEGINTPDIGIAEDAKKFVKKPSVLPRIAKIASVAASVVLCVTAVTLFSVYAFPRGDAAPPSSDDSANAPDAPAPPADGAKYYGDGELNFESVSAYRASQVDKSLKFIEKLSFAPNANVALQKCSFQDGGLAMARAEVVYIDAARYDAEIYVEYTDRIYAPLADYSKGETGYYMGMEYRLTRETAENGEPVNKLSVEKGGVKYYFNVQSSDINSYLLCLNLLA